MSSRSLNKVMLIGNLTRDPELRYTPQGTAVCTFGLATNRSWLPEGASERREETEFHRIVAWNKLGELCAQLLAKGRKVFVEGRLSTRTWTAQDGTQRTTTEIVIDDMIILDSKRIVVGQEAQGMQTQNVSATTPNVSTTPTVSLTPPPTTTTTTTQTSPVEEIKVEEKAAGGEEVGKKKRKTAEKKEETEEEKPSELNTDDIPF